MLDLLTEVGVIVLLVFIPLSGIQIGVLVSWRGRQRHHLVSNLVMDVTSAHDGRRRVSKLHRFCHDRAILFSHRVSKYVFNFMAQLLLCHRLRVKLCRPGGSVCRRAGLFQILRIHI